MYETSDFFYSVITFSYTKCFVHSYTVDVILLFLFSKISRKFVPGGSSLQVVTDEYMFHKTSMS